MLEYLHVKNIALIKEAELALSDGLNILSGETGAGKSILLGSLGLALGERGGTDLLRTGESEGLVELVFSIEDPKLLEKLSELEVEPEEGKLILSRKISEKRSVLRLNSETVSASFVRKISSLLLDIHGQHEHQSLLSEENHLPVLDGFSGKSLDEALSEYRSRYEEYRVLKEKIRSLGGGDDEERKNRLDFLEFQISEIEKAEIRIGEEDALTEEQKKLASASTIEAGLSEALDALSEHALESVSSAIRAVQGLTSADPGLRSLVSELLDIESLLQDARDDTSERLLSVDTDEEKRNAVEERLNFLSRMKRRYGGSEEAILSSLDRLRNEYDTLKNFDENKEQLLEKLSVLRKKLIESAHILHEERVKAAADFEREMTKSLQDLNFMQVVFKAEVTKTSRFTKSGADEVRFLISTNPGEPVKPLSKVASGGELSRIMLAIKTLSADTDRIGTLVFDEIDSGISGKTAAAVSRKLRLIAKNHQVICISHLPQIVAAADHHFLIEKNEEEGSAVTHVEELSEEDSIRELARLLGTGETTEAGLQNAREMKKVLKPVK